VELSRVLGANRAANASGGKTYINAVGSFGNFGVGACWMGLNLILNINGL
jgi:hypothetical protein